MKTLKHERTRAGYTWDHNGKRGTIQMGFAASWISGCIGINYGEEHGWLVDVKPNGRDTAVEIRVNDAPTRMTESWYGDACDLPARVCPDGVGDQFRGILARQSELFPGFQVLVHVTAAAVERTAARHQMRIQALVEIAKAEKKLEAMT